MCLIRLTKATRSLVKRAIRLPRTAASPQVEQSKAAGLVAMVGLDLEWPWDRNGEDNALALVQIATPDKARWPPSLGEVPCSTRASQIHVLCKTWI